MILRDVHPQDVSVEPFKTFKRFTFTHTDSGSGVFALKANSGSFRAFYSSSALSQSIGEFNQISQSLGKDKSTWYSGGTFYNLPTYYMLNHKFYERFSNRAKFKNHTNQVQPFLSYGPSNTNLNFRELHDSASLITIPQQLIGEEIKPKSVRILDNISHATTDIRNDGDGNFKIHEYINMSWSFDAMNQYGNPMASLLVDLNNDSFDDIVFWNFDNREWWSDAEEGYILLSNGTKTIQDWEQISLPQGPFGYNHNKYNHAAFGDLNNDGFNDVVVAVTRDLPYYEGAYIQVLLNDGKGQLIDETDKRFKDQPRADTHHGEGNIYLRDMNQDGFLDIVHSTRDYFTEFHGAHIAINDGTGVFNSLPNSVLPKRPDKGFNNHHELMKGLPINADNEACLDLISVTDAGFGNEGVETTNFLFTIINKKCDF